MVNMLLYCMLIIHYYVFIISTLTNIVRANKVVMRRKMMQMFGIIFNYSKIILVYVMTFSIEKQQTNKTKYMC